MTEIGFKDWQTPPDFFAALDKEFHFTLDAAASHENALCPIYCTVDGLFDKTCCEDSQNWRTCEPCGWQLDATDGLTTSWAGERVFCNPPYDSSLSQWVEKAAKREAEVAVLLLPPSVDTAWYHQLVGLTCDPEDSEAIAIERWGHKWAGFGIPNTGLYFMAGRLKFWKDGKSGPAPRAGNLLAVFCQ